MHLVKMTMKWPSSMISRGPKMFRYKIHWKLTFYIPSTEIIIQTVVLPELLNVV